MIKNHIYSTPFCCDDFMRLVNAVGNSGGGISYFIFHCDKCGRVMQIPSREMEDFEEEEE